MSWSKFFSGTLYGDPKPAGSKRAFVPRNPKTGLPFVNKQTGSIVANTVDANPKSGAWKRRVGNWAQVQHGARPLVDGPILARFLFMELRPQGHFGTGRNSHILKPSAPEFPAKDPDLLKLARAIEDALQKVVYVDDNRIVSEILHKRYAPKPGVKIELFVWKGTIDVDRT